MITLDTYLLITQGQFSPINEIKMPGSGWFVYIEEDIIDVPRRRGGGSGTGVYDKERYDKKKRIRLKVKLEEDKIFEKEIILDNVNLKVSNVKQVENDIIVEVYDPTIEDIDTKINIVVKPLFDE